MKIHFVYAFPPDSPQIQSPYSITKNLHRYLREKGDVKYYLWDKSVVPDLAPDDILIGHPNYPENTPMQRVFREGRTCRLRCLIHPLHTKRVGDNMPFDFMAKQADRIFSICGPYWYDTIGDTPFAHWKPKITRLDMAVDGMLFPYVKEKFADPGKRKLVYIGSAMPHKNLAYMTQLMTKMPDVQLDWYGGSSNHPLATLPNVNVTGWITLNKAKAIQIANECDIMINTSMSDANPTTLLEARAWGLITACTKESGYYNDPFFTELFLGNMDKSIEAIRGLLTAPSDELMERSIASRREIVLKYTWARFCKTIWTEVLRLI